jgi:orotidine-5'-phosphate decarboxylase
MMEAALVSLDLQTTKEVRQLVTSIDRSQHVYGYKLGALCSLSLGLRAAVSVIRAHSSKPIVFDHQKAGNDIPDISRRLVQLTASVGVSGFILFPFAGPSVMGAMIEECTKLGVTPIVGARMTHAQFETSEGGFLSEDVCDKILEHACKLGVENFVVPGNRRREAQHQLNTIRRFVPSPTLWAPGIGRQGGSVGELSTISDAGVRIVPIVGSLVYLDANPEHALQRMFGGMAHG